MINPNWRKPASDPEVLQRNETIFNLETKANVIKSLERHEISTVRKTNVLEEIEKLERKSAADYNKSKCYVSFYMFESFTGNQGLDLI